MMEEFSSAICLGQFVAFILTFRRIDSSLSGQTKRPSSDTISELNQFNVKNEKECPECGEYTLEEKEGSLLICSECNHVKMVREGDDLNKKEKDLFKTSMMIVIPIILSVCRKLSPSCAGLRPFSPEAPPLRE